MALSVIWCIELTAERMINLKWLKLSREGHTAMQWWYSGSSNTYYIRFICLCPCIIIHITWSGMSESLRYGCELSRINAFYLSPWRNRMQMCLALQCCFRSILRFIMKGCGEVSLWLNSSDKQEIKDLQFYEQVGNLVSIQDTRAHGKSDRGGVANWALHLAFDGLFQW